MGIALFVLYTTSFILQVILLVQALKKSAPPRWKRLYVIELISAAIAAAAAVYYNGLPGTGFMPGLTYLAEVIFSMAAALLFSAMLVLSFLLSLISRWRHRT